jgi:acetyl esterase/lipase
MRDRERVSHRHATPCAVKHLVVVRPHGRLGERAVIIADRLAPEFAAFRERQPVIATLDPRDLPAARRRHRMLIDATPVDLSQVVVRDLTVSAPGGQPTLDLRMMTPDASPPPAGWPVVLWIHGGGYLVGCPEMDDARLREMALAASCAVVAPRYRLAPEHPYPAGLDDCFNAFRWAQEEAGAERLDGARIAIAGASAGGGLAVALALRVRDAALPRPARLVVYAPMLDDRADPDDAHAIEDSWTWNAARNRFAWGCYLGRRDTVPSDAAPARAADLAGLPPTFLAVGALDPFLGENLAFVRDLSAAGVEVEAHVVPGAPHGFETADASATAATIRRAANATLARSLAPVDVEQVNHPDNRDWRGR